MWKQYSIVHRQPHSTFYDLLSHWLGGRAGAASDTGGQSDTFWALRDVEFEIQPGEVVGVIGRNGAGKSTLLKILSRITAPSRGQIEVRGRLASLLEVGTGFHPELSGRENVFLNGSILGMSRREVAAKFDEIVAFAEVENFIDTPVKRYSSGMYVRLAFAVAAHLEPEVLVVDEVLAVGDAQFQQRCLGKLRSVSQSGRAVILVSHNLDAIQMLCSRALWLDKGAMRAIDQTASVVQRYHASLPSIAGLVEHDANALRIESVAAQCVPTESDQMTVSIEVRLLCLSAVNSLWVDFGVENSRDVRLIQVVPAARGLPSVSAAPGEMLTYRIKATVTTLKPGEIFGTLYAHTLAGGPVLHVTRIALFRVAPKPGMGDAMSPTFTAILSPDYECTLKAGNP